MKYIFVAGAPGSKWSSVVKNIYYSPDIDQSDYREDWTYYHDASGKIDLMHLGAYFDPGMECDLPESMSTLTRRQAEERFDAPFNSNSKGIRIIKSHIFSYKENIEYLKELWPESHIVLVHRSDDSCLGWWVKCGHFNITYPSYHGYYKDLRQMAEIIKRQNKGILSAWWAYKGKDVTDNVQLAKTLNIAVPEEQYRQDYVVSDVRVKVI
jgi:hypothetical protein